MTNVKEKKARGWVLYDGECSLCVRLAKQFERLLTRRGFHLAPLKEWERGRRAPLAGDRQEMLVLTAGGEWIGGADAVLYLARWIWWAWPLYWILRAPGMPPLFRAAYRSIAARRHAILGTCRQGACRGR